MKADIINEELFIFFDGGALARMGGSIDFDAGLIFATIVCTKAKSAVKS